MRRGAARQKAAGQRIRNGRESMEEMLRADNITFSYTDDQHRAVDGLSLRVKRGEYVAVLGANGCGKSTLAKHFNAILLPQAAELCHALTAAGCPMADDIIDVEECAAALYELLTGKKAPGAAQEKAEEVSACPQS